MAKAEGQDIYAGKPCCETGSALLGRGSQLREHRRLEQWEPLAVTSLQTPPILQLKPLLSTEATKKDF